MRRHSVIACAALTVLVPLTASAQTVNQLVANHALLNAELNRCKQLGMASVDDARCKTAWTAENKRFFGSGATYTEKPIVIYPGLPVPDTSPPKPTSVKPPNGQ